jgi:unsaturated chondroitin disaccharide hydrolase
MGRTFIFLAIISSFTFFSCTEKKVTINEDNVFKVVGNQLLNQVHFLNDTNLNPRSVNYDGTTILVKSKDWTSGFFPGCLWMQYEYTKDEFWKNAADKYTQNTIDQQYNGKTHDMGFKMYCSFGNGYRLIKDSIYKEVLIQSAKTLSTRFNPKVGCIKSWDHHNDKWQFPVIIDNMMNLELLFWANKETGDSSYYNIAVSHANTTLKNHYRADYSSFHVVAYDSITGEVIMKNTHQGYANESAWARGQAWGLYGFTMCFRETGDSAYLNQAIHIADFILNHKNLPDDNIPYWDFDAPKIPNEERDASAAAVICSAFYELSKFVDFQKENYLKAADKILYNLSSDKYFAKAGENNNFILMHSVGSKPQNSEVDVPIIYADYYYLEALLRKHYLEE